MDVFPETLTGARLRLDRLSRATVDVQQYHAYCSRDAPDIDAVTRYLPWEPHETVAETREYLVAVPLEVGNERSRRAVKRYVDAHGGQYEGVVRNKTTRANGDAVDQHRFTVTREQYANATDD